MREEESQMVGVLAQVSVVDDELSCWELELRNWRSCRLRMISCARYAILFQKHELPEDEKLVKRWCGERAFCGH